MGIFDFIKKKYQEGKAEYERYSADVSKLKKRELYMGAGKEYYDLCPGLSNEKAAETEANPAPAESVMESEKKMEKP